MDALRNSHRMLAENGVLLDLHPIPPSMHAFSEGKNLGVVDQRQFFRAVRSTARELDRLVAEGLFAHETQMELDVLERFGTADDLFETVDAWDDIHLSKRLRGRIARATPPIDFHERLVLRRYRRTRARFPQPPDSHQRRVRLRVSS